MTALFLAALLSASGAAFAEPSALKACVKWSKDIPEAQAAGGGLFASVSRVSGDGPHPECDVVAATESFGVGWLMRAWMKEGVFSSCGERLGGYKINYKGEEWQTKLVKGLHEFLAKNPGALAGAKPCTAPSAPPSAVPASAPPVAAPVPSVSTAPLTPSLPAEPVTPSTGTR